MEPETDGEGGRVPVPPGPEAPKRWPWGRITAVVVVALVTITALAIAVRQPNRPPSITDVSVSDDIAIAGASPPKLLFTAHATDPGGNAPWGEVWSWNNASEVPRGGAYLVVSAADNGSLFSFGYSWGDGTAKTAGTALEVGHAGHRFSSPGTYFVQLTVSSGAFTKSSGYTVRVVAGAPLAQLKYPDIFAAATAQEPDSLEPAIDNDSAGGEVLQNVYETLIAVPSGIESVDPLVPRLATDVPSMANNGTSPDGRNYTFQLRTDVMFHDQTRMTATDVSSSFRRLLAIHPADGPSRILEGLM